MTPRQWLTSGSIVAGVAVALIAVGTLTGSPAGAPEAGGPSTAPTSQAVQRDDQSQRIASAQAALSARPDDYATWADLGILYVQQAKSTVDPSFYAKAEGAIARSLKIDQKDNYEGWAGQAALLSGRHDFAGALVAARRSIAINKYNYLAFGALGDALTQLGRYDEAAAAVDQMNQLRPSVPSFTRASYTLELRGDIARSRAALLRAVQDSTGPGDMAFSRYYLAELAFNYGGDLQEAMTQLQQGLAVVPTNVALRGGRARIEAALGQTEAALADYRAVTASVPDPQLVLELGELLQSRGDTAGATTQYDLFRTEEKLFEAGGVALDVEPTLFEADHGDAAAAVRRCLAGWKVRPFVEMADACAWAYHAAGRDTEALGWAQKAFASGWAPALPLFHKGMIELSLGQKAQAKADLTKALKTNPHFNVLQAPVAVKALASLG